MVEEYPVDPRQVLGSIPSLSIVFTWYPRLELLKKILEFTSEGVIRDKDGDMLVIIKLKILEGLKYA